MIHGIGIEALEISRFKRAMDRRAGLCPRLFTEGEIVYCMSQKNPEKHLAARFAAKVSFFKALGRRLCFTDVEVTRDLSGRPSIRAKGIDESFRINVTIAHDDDLGIAETIIEK